MSDQKCQLCHRLCSDGYACHECAKDAGKHLESLAYLLEHVDDKRARYGTNFKRNPGSRPAETPIPFDPRVSKVVDPIVSGLIGTYNVVIETGTYTPRHFAGPHEMARWLALRVDWLRTVPEGPEEFAWLQRADQRLERLFDRIEHVFLGPCRAVIIPEDRDLPEVRCSEVIYAELDTRGELPAFARCRHCGADVDVKARRSEFRDRVKVYQATMKELVYFAPMLLEDSVSEWKLRELARRGYLQPVGARKVLNLREELRTVSTYRMGDVEGALKRYRADKEAETARRVSRV